MKENERLGAGLFIALILHAAAFLLAGQFFSFNFSTTEEKKEPILIQLDFFEPPATEVLENNKIDKVVENRIDSQKTSSVSSGTDLKEALNKSDSTNPKIADPVPVPGPMPDPKKLESGTLSRLDDLLSNVPSPDNKDPNAPVTQNSTASGNGSTADTQWDDKAGRQPLYRTEPEIPHWVLEQGLRLKVEIFVNLTSDGFIIVTGVKTSSGYPDVDTAVSLAISRWKYSRTFNTGYISGVITYTITPK